MGKVSAPFWTEYVKGETRKCNAAVLLSPETGKPCHCLGEKLRRNYQKILAF